MDGWSGWEEKRKERGREVEREELDEGGTREWKAGRRSWRKERRGMGRRNWRKERPGKGRREGSLIEHLRNAPLSVVESLVA